MRITLFFIILLFAVPCFAEGDKLIKIDTRPDVTVAFYYMKRVGAKATVVLLTGGAGGIGMKDGIPTSKNFLVRSRDFFASNGFNVAVVNKPSDISDLKYEERVSPKHIENLHQVVSYLKKDSGLPIWFVGTSRGTISATASAISFGNSELAGIVLTSSVTAMKKTGAVPYQKLDAIKIPVLVVHHEKDGCKICVPSDVPQILRGLTNTPVKKEMILNGGANPTGDSCEALHWHGFIGMEKEAVDIISEWIKHPVP